jgi:hypothetical protein
MKRSGNTFFCFSPPVMVATFCIELILAVYVLWRYKLNPTTRLAALTMVFLALFQLAEFRVCRGAAGDALQWSRIGYVAIAMLPPLGLHLAFTIAGVKRRWLLVPVYAMAAGFILFFGLVGHAITGHACLGNYVIFQVAPGSGGLYGLYYYSWLAIGAAACNYFISQTKRKQTIRALKGLMFGYAAFIIPTATVNLLSRNTLEAIPSIMCGFAVLLALALAFVVVPATMQKRS